MKYSTAGKLSASRRVSIRTTAPTAPSDSSSHMHQNRSWPGVPQRYSLSFWSGNEIRPKSIATVVVVFDSMPSNRSRRALAEVISASVVTGVISLTDRTSVVLPTPKPPATRIFSGTKGNESSGSLSEVFESIEQLLQEAFAGLSVSDGGSPQPHGAQPDEVGDQDLRDLDRPAQRRRDL